MRALWKAIVLFVFGIGAFIATVHTASANQCAINALQAAKNAHGDQHELGRIYDQYFGEALARQPVAKDWNYMSLQQKQAQIAYARRFVVSMASRLAEYANASFKWHGNVAFVTLNGKTIKLSVVMSGGCTFSNVCVDGKCLTSLIGDVRKHTRASR